MYLIEHTKSSLITSVEYDEETHEITFHFNSKYYVRQLTYINCSLNSFMILSNEPSLGKFYLEFFKPNFKLKTFTMADEQKKQPKGVNKAKAAMRYIKMRINVAKINKDWLTPGKEGTYLDVTLHMLPDGTVGNYDNLGMITQDVPNDVVKKEAKLDKKNRSQGAILGNGKELDWGNGATEESIPGNDAGATLANMTDEERAALEADLPF